MATVVGIVAATSTTYVATDTVVLLRIVPCPSNMASIAKNLEVIQHARKILQVGAGNKNVEAFK